MSPALKAGIVLGVAGCLAAGVLIVGKSRTRPPVTVTLRISVAPAEQSSFVAGEANSARFKYLLGKQAGVKPTLAQKLSVQPVPNSSLLEARVGVLTKDEGRRYAEAFVQTLQVLCGSQAQLALTDQSIR
jgi:hypothetical protein